MVSGAPAKPISGTRPASAANLSVTCCTDSGFSFEPSGGLPTAVTTDPSRSSARICTGGSQDTAPAEPMLPTRQKQPLALENASERAVLLISSA